MKLVFTIVRTDGRDAKKYELVRNRITLGRGEDNDIVLEADIVSTHHAKLEEIGGGVMLIDLGSTNGSSVNGRPVSGPVRVQVGDQLTFGINGPTLRIWELERAPAVPPPVPAPDPFQAAQPSGTRAMLADLQQSQARSTRSILIGVALCTAILGAIFWSRGGTPAGNTPALASGTASETPAAAALVGSGSRTKQETVPANGPAPEPTPPQEGPATLDKRGALWIGLETQKTMVPFCSCWCLSPDFVVLTGTTLSILKEIKSDETLYVCGQPEGKARIAIIELIPHPKGGQALEFDVGLARLAEPLPVSFTSAHADEISQIRVGDRVRCLSYVFPGEANAPLNPADPPRQVETELTVARAEQSAEGGTLLPVYRLSGPLPESADGGAIFDRQGHVIGTLVRAEPDKEHRVIPVDRLADVPR